MYRTFPTFVLTVALFAIAPALAAWGEDLEEWDDRTTLEDDNTHTLDSVDTGNTESLDSVEGRRDTDSYSAAPAAPVPAAEDGNWESQADRAKERIRQAEERLRAANVDYSEMRARNYPRGEAAGQITAERGAAEGELNEAWSDYGKIKRGAHDAGRPL
jgi:hypothetical protein